MRIKSWHMAVRNHRELIPKSVIGMHAHSPQPDPNMLDQMSKNITRQGITSSTLNYLRVSGTIRVFLAYVIENGTHFQLFSIKFRVKFWYGS